MEEGGSFPLKNCFLLAGHIKVYIQTSLCLLQTTPLTADISMSALRRIRVHINVNLQYTSTTAASLHNILLFQSGESKFIQV